MVIKKSGRKKRKSVFTPVIQEWLRAALIAIISVILVKYFVFDLVSIPDSSMERSLLPGDVLVVNKYNYGARAPLRIIPQRIYSAFFSTDSLVPVTQLPYWRIPGNRAIQQDDIVLFNIPAQQKRPVDKRSTYARRIVAMPGDMIEMRNSVVWVNEQVFTEPEHLQQNYRVESRGRTLDPELLKKLDIREGGKIRGRNAYIFPLTGDQADSLKKSREIRSLRPYVAEADTAFFSPFGDVGKDWSIDNFGPLEIPYKGLTIELNRENLAKYYYHIVYHERRKILVENDSIFINNIFSENYTFRMNYYFVLGDNRHNTSDSRIWGMVPENHIKGRVSGIFLSFDKGASFFRKIRWSRLFAGID
jgi:signal peptidase I